MTIKQLEMLINMMELLISTKGENYNEAYFILEQLEEQLAIKNEIETREDEARNCLMDGDVLKHCPYCDARIDSF